MAVKSSLVNAAGLKIVLVEMRQGYLSVGILNEEETEARFPIDWDDLDPRTARDIRDDIAKGLKKKRDIENMHAYTMPYPIRER